MTSGGEQGSKSIEFWFDFSSPYAYFAALQIDDIGARHGREVTWRPFLLGAVFQVTGMRSFSTTPMRGDYARHDWARLARRMGVPFRLPPNHPVITAAAGRAFLWLEREQPDIARAYARNTFETYYADGVDASGESAVLDLAESCGAPRAALAEALQSPELKAQFRARTTSAIERGVFGSPFFFVDGEPFWGADRLPMMEEWLSRGGW